MDEDCLLEKGSLSEPIIVPFADQFRRFCLSRPNKTHLAVMSMALVPAGFAAYKFCSAHRYDRFELLGLFATVLCGAIPWLIDLVKPWQCRIDGKGMNVIELTANGRWSWERLRWYREVLLSFEPSEWRGLPAITIKYECYIGRGRTVTAYMVYRPEDAESVRERVIPVLEHYLPHGPKYRTLDRDLAPAAPAENA